MTLAIHSNRVRTRIHVARYRVYADRDRENFMILPDEYLFDENRRQHRSDGTNHRPHWKHLYVCVRIGEALDSVRGFTIGGHNEWYGSLHNGNFLKELKLNGHFDYFLSKHIVQYGNSGRA